jgi:hypothetical protein
MDRNGKDNPAANHHSRMEGIPDDLESINEYFFNRVCPFGRGKEPWYADFANILVRWQVLTTRHDLPLKEKSFSVI